MAKDKLQTVVTAKTVATVPPKGLTISRKDNVFSAAWKIGDKDYGVAQEFAFRTVSATSWTYRSIGKKTTARSETISASQFYPVTTKKISAVKIHVRGCRDKYTKKTTKKNKALGKYTLQTDYIPTMSDWAKEDFAIYPPKAPTLTTTFNTSSSNACTFGWTIPKSESDHYWVYDLKWESVLVKNCNYSEGKNAPWKSTATGYQSGTSTSNTSVTITESNIPIDEKNSYTRWFRAKCRGAGGDSAWAYAKHVYGVPYQATIKSVAVNESSGLNYGITMSWEVDANSYAHPIDKTTCEYNLAVPEAGMVAPDDGWTDATETTDTKGTNASYFATSRLLADDECLFVRVSTMHDIDSNTTNSKPWLAKVGKLSKPENLSVVPNQSNYKATITAENTSEVDDSFLAVVYRASSSPSNPRIIGIIPSGQTSVVVQAPDWSGETSKDFGVFACVGTYTDTIGADGVHDYALNKRMESEIEYDGGTLPSAPTGVTATPTTIPNTIRVTWDWAWDRATGAELSWADHPDAWESTDEPETYTVSNMYTSAWNISGLEAGITWYVRVRLVDESGEDPTYSPWSETYSLDLASAPDVPALTLTPTIITPTGSTTASWAYSTTDGTMQAHATIAEVTTVEGEPFYTEIATAETAQHITLNAKDVGWQAGETHNLVIKVTSASGKQSDDWSLPTPIIIADPLVATVTQTSLQTIPVPEDDEAETTRQQLSLTAMPMTVTVTGAGVGGTTIVAIERAEDYRTQRPDERYNDGFEGETVYLTQRTGEEQITINQGDLIGNLDDGAQYRLVATVMDGLGQSDTADPIEFEVHWTRQALIPSAEVYTDEDGLYARLTPIAPTGWQSGDTCDIYRLSVDRPELIYKGAAFGETYIDPYPTVGNFGGHRFVYMTVNGDYITADNNFAWYDTTDNENDFLDMSVAIIDFGGDRVILEYDMETSSSWKKAFTSTRYLGGAIQGDWSVGVERSGSLAARSIILDDEGTIEKMRRLADYEGICHVRTPDGSSYAANVECSEKQSSQNGGQLAEFDLSITKVDPEGFDGVPLSRWVES